MTYSQIEKAAKIYESIKELDDKIIQLEKYALRLADKEDGEVGISLSIPIVKEESKEKILTEDGSLYLGNAITLFNPWIISGGASKQKDDKDRHKIKGLSTSTALRVIGCIMGDYQEQRDRLIKRLDKLNKQ